MNTQPEPEQDPGTNLQPLDPIEIQVDEVLSPEEARIEDDPTTISAAKFRRQMERLGFRL